MASGKSEEELMTDIAERIAKNQISFDSKSEDEKKKLAKQMQMVSESQLTEMKKSFNKLIGNTTEQVSLEARMLVLEGIYDRVNTYGLKSLDSAFSSPEILKFAEVIIKEEKNRNKEFDNDENNIIRDVAYIENLKENERLEVVETKNNIYSGQGAIKDTFNKMDRSAMNMLIERANSGDEESQAVVTAIMSVASFTKIDKKFEDLKVFQKTDLLFGMEFLAASVEEFNSKEALDFLMEIGEKTGIQIVEVDNNGNKTVNRKKLEDIFEENGIDYIKQTKEMLLDRSKNYENLADYDDMIAESTIEYSRNEMYKGYNELVSKLKNGEITEQEFTDLMTEIINTDLDAAIRFSSDVSKELKFSHVSGIEKKCIKNIMIHVYDEFQKAQNGEMDFKIDNYVMKYIYSSMESACEYMVENKDKNLMETMLKIEPQKTKEFFDKAKQENEIQKEQEEQPKTRNRVLTDEEKIQNLSISLSKMQELKGTEVATDFIIHQLDENKDKEKVRNYFMKASLNMFSSRDISYEENERLARKKLFEKIIHEKSYDEEALKMMIGMDFTTVKEVLDDLLEMQNSRQDDRLDTIMDLSSKMKEASERKVITADKVDVKDILENMVGKDTRKDEEIEF